jgi:hypothetical protein
METLGYEEWRDGFNFENIPSTLLDKSFHIESGDVVPTTSNHQLHEFSSPIVIRVYLKGFLDPVEAIDNAYDTADDILAEILLPSNRLGTNVKDIVPTNISVKPLNDQNDNSVLLELSFEGITFNRF